MSTNMSRMVAFIYVLIDGYVGIESNYPSLLVSLEEGRSEIYLVSLRPNQLLVS